MILTLPWPPRELSPNARVHWARKASATKDRRNMAYFMAVQARDMGFQMLAPHVSITFNPPDKRPRDLDNMLASMKSALDGIAHAIGVDDSKWSISIRKGEPVKGGQVVVCIAESLEDVERLVKEWRGK